jgi:TetR/AcrR family fatty acid metabolism transcriptional regulator
MPKISPSARRALTEQRKTQILTAAAKVFAAKGFERATIANIAREAGIAEGSIYNYFKNKGDLLVSIPRQVVEPPVESISAAMQMIGTRAAQSPNEVLTTIASNLVSTIRQNAQVFRILVSALPSMKQATREKYLNHVVPYATGTLEDFFRLQIRQGVFRKDSNPRILARAFVGMFFPFVMLRELLQVEEKAVWTYDQVIAEVVPLFVRGVLAEPPERKTS